MNSMYLSSTALEMCGVEILLPGQSARDDAEHSFLDCSPNQHLGTPQWHERGGNNKKQLCCINSVCFPVAAAAACVFPFLHGRAAALGRKSPGHMQLQDLGLVAALLQGGSYDVHACTHQPPPAPELATLHQAGPLSSRGSHESRRVMVLAV